MGSYHVSGHFCLEGKHSLSYHYISPRWLGFGLLLDKHILPNQRGFFNFIPLKFSINSGIGGFVAIASAPASPDLTRYYGIKSAPSSRYRLFGKAFIPESLFVAHIPVPLGVA
jgi:hypothetical protein